MRKIYAIYGAGGHGREVLPLLREKIGVDSFNEICFIVDDKEESLVNGISVYNFDEFCKLEYEKKFFSVSIADSKVRSSIFARCESNKIIPFTLIASNSVIMDNNDIGPGAILSPFTCITSNIKIGKSFHANIYSHVSHDCIIGDFVTFGPGVRCNGNVIIEDHAYIGSGAMIKQGTKQKPTVIGAYSVVGMGAVVTKNVPPNTTVMGNPARVKN